MTARAVLPAEMTLPALTAPAGGFIVDWADDDDTVDTDGANGGADVVHPVRSLVGVLPQDSQGSLVAGLTARTAADGIGSATDLSNEGGIYGARGADDASLPCTREAPRFILTPGACAVIVLVLTVALCACLVLLVKQGTALAKFAQGEESAYSRPSTYAGSGNGETARSGAATQPAPAQSDAGQSVMQPSEQSAMQPSEQPSAQPSTQPSMEPSAQHTQLADSGASASGDGSSAGGGLVNINTATSEQLQTVKGIGPATARKIIEYRDAHGPYASVDELLNVDGIGAKTVQNLRGKVTV